VYAYAVLTPGTSIVGRSLSFQLGINAAGAVSNFTYTINPDTLFPNGVFVQLLLDLLRCSV
jgi:hypothetical protein